MVIQKLFLNRLPFLRIGGVDALSLNADARRSLNLVAHQGQQRGYQKRKALTGVAQQAGGQKINHAFTPTGPLHHQQSLFSE